MESDRWLGVELRHLAALQAIAQHGSFGRAASALGYTQSAVSQQIATLERIVGPRLIERPGGPRPVELTEAGRMLLAHAEAIVARLQAARADMEALQAGEAGTLRVGAFQSAGARILPELLRRFTAAWPQVGIRLEEAEDESLLGAIEDGGLDLAFVMLPVPGAAVETVELVSDPYVLLTQADSPLARAQTPPTFREIGAMPLIGYRTCLGGQQVEERLRTAGVEPRMAFRSDDNATLQAMVAAGMGIALVPRLTVNEADSRVTVIELGDRVPPRLIGLAWHRDRYRSPAALAFVEAALELCAELQEAA
ncbi:MAG TPA: LysR substrate-binding domain-containing protein [Gaiellales bacterium]|jgi:molybdate transport repressor ModE-like protein